MNGVTEADNHPLRFDGRVAIVTGAGGAGSLGAAFAHLLAARGAKVVVNSGGRNRDDAVAKAIVAAGGEAISDLHSVAQRDSAAGIALAALDRWGRIDIVVNNAGATWSAGFAELSDDDLQTTLGVHLMGSIWMCRAAWPHMQRQAYGRIVNISSRAMHGLANVAIYGVAKAGQHGLTKALAVEGLAHDIRVNSVLPRAYTPTVEGGIADSEFRRSLMANTPEQVAPTVAYLAHESCSMTGRAFYSCRGHVLEVFSSDTVGYEDADPTPESVRDHLHDILDRTGAVAVTEADSADRQVFATHAPTPGEQRPPRH